MKKELDILVDYIPDGSIVRLTTMGYLTLETEERFVEAGLAALKQYNARRCLIDHRKTKLDMGVIHISDLPKRHQRSGVPQDLSVAIIFTPSETDTPAFKFYENINFLAGMKHFVFTDEKAALDWLAKQ